jgi:hypothetical protein
MGSYDSSFLNQVFFVGFLRPCSFSLRKCVDWCRVFGLQMQDLPLPEQHSVFRLYSSV